MLTIRRTTAAIASAALIATPLAVLGAAPASADGREFFHHGAAIDFDADLDDGRYEIDVSVDDATPGSRWKVVLRQNGKVFHKQVHRADNDGEFDVDRHRPNTRGKDVFKLKIKKIGAGKAAKVKISRR